MFERLTTPLGVPTFDRNRKKLSEASANGENPVEFCQAARMVRDVVSTLETITGLDRIWKHGLVHHGGPHYRLRGRVGPVSIGEDECLIFGKLIGHFKPAHCFIIGNGFGMSSATIAKIMEANGGQSVITLDNRSEGDGERCFQIAEQLRVRLDCRILQNKAGSSPQDIERASEGCLLDLAFIDGGHLHPQATEDFLGIQPSLKQDAILCWHDYWLEGVSRSVAKAQSVGYRCAKIESSCEMVIGTKSDSVFRRIDSLFDDLSEPTPRHHPLAHCKRYGPFIWPAIKARLRVGG